MSDLGAYIDQRPAVKAHHYPVKLMGCGFVLTAVHADPQVAWDAIRAGVREIVRIERLISSWLPDSQTSAINRAAGQHPVRVDRELFDLVARSLRVSALTAGAFDISGNLSRHYWQFDRGHHAMLPEEKIHELRDLINYRLIELDADRQTIFLRRAGMQIGFGGIGKGYAAYRASQTMCAGGVTSGLINASGDLMCWGQPPDKPGWKVDVLAGRQLNQMPLQVTLPEGSIVTSGWQENYCMIDGIRHSHIVDPRTGRPTRETQQVSVICTNPELGDALATALSVLGPTAGLPLIDRLHGVECIMADQQGKIHFSKNLKCLLHETSSN